MGLYVAEGIFILACAGIVYLLARAYPVAREQAQQEEQESKRFHISSETIYAWDKKILTSLEKGLRRVRVAILKVDHAVSQKLDSVKKKTEAHEKNSLHVFAELEKKDEKEEETTDAE
ncbi:MAG: hypothetical protein M1320_01635 [Patescibacteria group bacterium]|nr:hypothetical protein [Patescibacteria group bacterium]